MASQQSAPITIGQWSPFGQKIVTQLEADGGKALQADCVALFAPFGWPVISIFVGAVCSAVAHFMISKIDNIIFAGYVAKTLGKQVSDYIKAQATGNTTPGQISTTDKAIDTLVGLGNE